MNAPHAKNPLFTPVEFLNGVGPARAALMNRLGIFKAFDLLFFFPRDYQDLTHSRKIDALEEDLLQAVAGRVEHFTQRPTRRGPIVTLEIGDGSGAALEGVWFNQPWQAERFALGRNVLMIGKPVRKSAELWQMSHPKLIWGSEASDSEETLKPTDPYLPIYPLTAGLHLYHLHRVIRILLETLPDLLEEVFPKDYLAAHDLPGIAEAVRSIHFPKTPDEAARARRRFVYQEFLLLQLALGIRRKQHEVNLKAPVIERTPAIDARIRRLLPFDLTEAQNRVIGEIASDLARPVPMNRLLQGDVASGKTAVALYAMLLTVAADRQAVLMAPTEILARQHLRFITRLLDSSRVTVVSLLGGQKPAERSDALKKIESGEAGLIIGTQAIVCNEIDYARLGLVVIDEQHKFGVMQRASLKTAGKLDPHYLVMTATPIPRSVTMTLFGDLDVSTLDGSPPGRQKVHTYVVDESKKARWWDFFRRKLKQGRQGYVVVPRVETTDEDLKSTQAAFEELSTGELAGFRLGVVHGRMSPEEKESVMLDFRSGAIQTLISTSVIEVGVDIPNATLMTIENGSRFGLAQLHQLRGRIGRGNDPGWCAVFDTPEEESDASGSSGKSVRAGRGNRSEPTASDPKSLAARTIKKAASRQKAQKKKSEISTAAERPARPRNDGTARLEIFARSTDGFFLAEKDLELRGPGELFGTQQHGLCPFRVADLIRDQAILLTAKEDAAALLAADPGLATPPHHALRRQVLARYGAVLELGDVG